MYDRILLDLAYSIIYGYVNEKFLFSSNGTFINGQDFESIVGYDEDGVDLNRNYDINWIHGHTHKQKDKIFNNRK